MQKNIWDVIKFIGMLTVALHVVVGAIIVCSSDQSLAAAPTASPTYLRLVGILMTAGLVCMFASAIKEDR